MKTKAIILPIILAVLIVGAVFLFSNPNKTQNDAQLDLAIQEIDNASIQLNNLSANYIEDSSIFRIPTYLLNNEYINVDTFCSLTNCEISMNNCLVASDFTFDNYVDGYAVKTSQGGNVANIYALAECLGYDCQLVDNKYELTRRYATKRIMVYAQNLNVTYGSVERVQIDDLNVLQYRTELDAFYAFENFKENGYVCQIDTIVKCDTESLDAMNVVGSDSCSQWAGEMMGLDKYKSYLEEVSNQLNEVVVAVVDSGIMSSHNLFQGRILEQYAKSFVPGESVTSDGLGHGTHVAGTIAYWTHSNVQILPIKIFDSEGKSDGSQLVLVYKYLNTLKDSGVNIKVVNCSYGADWTNYNYAGLGTYSDVDFVEINKLIDKSIAVCASAGNDSKNSRNQAPACYKGVVSVSAIDENYNLASFSNFGDIDFCAPGVKIVSCGTFSDSTYIAKSGTSMAAPHISATFALLFSNPIENYTFVEAYDLCKTRCFTDLGPSGWDESFGYGCIDLTWLLFDETTEDTKTYDIVFQIASLNDFSNTNMGEYSMSYLDENNRIQKIERNNFEFNQEQITTRYSMFLDAKPKNSFDFCGWYVSTSETWTNGELVGSKNMFQLPLDKLQTNNTIYIFAVIELIYVDITLNFIYKDVSQYTGFASFATLTKVSYVQNKDSWKSQKETFECGMFAHQQTFSICAIRGTTLSLEVIGENDSCIKRIIYIDESIMCKDYNQNAIRRYFSAKTLNIVVIVEI